MSVNNGICLVAIKLTKDRLLEERVLIDEKIKALDIVIEMFDEEVKNSGKEDKPKKPRATYGTLTPEEKKKRKKESMDKWLAKKKLEVKKDTPDKKIDYDKMA